MADNSIRTPSIYIPKSLNELINEKGRNPEAVLFAGGTYIMSRPHAYPRTDANDIISVNSIPELLKFTHTDRFLETGAAVTLENLLNTGSYLLSKNTFKAIENVGTSVIRAKATIGGSLCTKERRFAMSCILATIGSQVEVRVIQKSRLLKKRIKSSQSWIPVRKLYSSSGELLIGNNTIITRVRIPATDNAIQIFRFLGSPLREPDQCVCFGLSYTPIQNGLSQTSMCIAYPENGFFFSNEFNSGLSTLAMPADEQQIESQKNELKAKLEEHCPNITKIQKERTVRLFVSVIQEINQSFMTLV